MRAYPSSWGKSIWIMRRMSEMELVSKTGSSPVAGRPSSLALGWQLVGLVLPMPAPRPQHPCRILTNKSGGGVCGGHGVSG